LYRKRLRNLKSSEKKRKRVMAHWGKPDFAARSAMMRQEEETWNEGDCERETYLAGNTGESEDDEGSTLGEGLGAYPERKRNG